MSTRCWWNGGRFGSLVVFIVGGGVMFGLAAWVEVPSVAPLDVNREETNASLVVTRTEHLPSGGELRERLWLSDPSPLFLPVESVGIWTPTEGADKRAGGAVTGAFGPVFKFGAIEDIRRVVRPANADDAGATAARLGAGRWFEGLARQATPEASGVAERRVARVNVYRIGAAIPVATLDLTRGLGLEEPTWRPMVLTALVAVTGVVGAPTVATSSGRDEIDERIRSIVRDELLPTLSLRPGSYRFEVGP